MATTAKPSFFSSVIAGITGTVKGLFAGGITGAIAGAAVGAAVFGIGLLTTPIAIGGAAALTFGTALAWSAGAGAILFGALGSAAGTVTGVVKSREGTGPSAEDVVSVAKVSFAQGVNVGLAASQEVGDETKFTDMIKKQRGQEPSHKVH